MPYDTPPSETVEQIRASTASGRDRAGELARKLEEIAVGLRGARYTTGTGQLDLLGVREKINAAVEEAWLE